MMFYHVGAVVQCADCGMKITRVTFGVSVHTEQEQLVRDHTRDTGHRYFESTPLVALEPASEASDPITMSADDPV